MKIISVSSQKGGTGKTTSSINIGVGLGILGKKILLIDCDPQSHLTISLGFEEDTSGSISDILTKRMNINDAIKNIENISLITSNNFQEKVIENLNDPNLLNDVLSELDINYDYIIIDTPPNLGILTINSFVASTDIWIPVKCNDYLSLKSLSKIENLFEIIKNNYNHQLKISGYMPTFYTSNILLANEILKRLKSTYGDKVFLPIRKNISIAEAPISKKSIYGYNQKTHGANDYMKVCKSIISR
jgi:chromosome partitioning protein